ncbi:MAG: AAA family ATPase [Candidatus Omnitrophota bacterium]|jgi:SpoVK/Ycf46/Vps4 family AAA+-type ATPase|nr:MAG: AAA family ATPase [Candidatus Omnitrophota bacterium]
MSENKQERLNALIEALKFSPDNVPLRKEVAAICEELLRWDEAYEHYSILCAEDSSHIDSFLGLGRSAIALARWERAVAAFKAALDKNRRHPQANYWLSKALREKGDIESARKHYEIAVSEQPELENAEERNELYPDGASPKNILRIHRTTEEEPGEFGLEKPTITFSDVGGLEELKETIRRKIILPFERPDIFKAYGKKAGGGVLLYGPPGCGKTHIARATAGECRANFFCVEINDILDMWFGESEKRLNALFEKARQMAPSIIFFDEVDAIGGVRNRMRESPGKTLVSQLLAEMDGYQTQNQKLLVIGATNAPWHVDPALRRPGRFDQVIFVAPPDLQARAEIMTIHCKGRPIENVDFVKLAKKCNGFSGADLKALVENSCEEAMMRSLASGTIEPVTMKEFTQSLAKLKPTTREWLSVAKNYATYANEGGMYDEVIDYLKKK